MKVFEREVGTCPVDRVSANHAAERLPTNHQRRFADEGGAYEGTSALPDAEPDDRKQLQSARSTFASERASSTAAGTSQARC